MARIVAETIYPSISHTKLWLENAYLDLLPDMHNDVRIGFINRIIIIINKNYFFF